MYHQIISDVRRKARVCMVSVFTAWSTAGERWAAPLTTERLIAYAFVVGVKAMLTREAERAETETQLDRWQDFPSSYT